MTGRALALIALLVLVSCARDATSPGLPVASVTITPSVVVLVPDSSVQLAAVLTDSLGQTLSGRSITWTSSDTTVAVVSSSGVARGRVFPSWMPTGYAAIRASAEGKTGTASALVLRKLARLRVMPESLTIFTGQTSLLEAAVADTAGQWVRVGRAIWNSADTTRAVVDSFGTVRGVRAGTAQISSRAAGLSASGTIRVIAPVVSITIQPHAPSLVVGHSVQLVATIRDSAGNVLNDRQVTWTQPGRPIALLSASGLATATAAGSTSIVATAEGHSDTATISVTVDGPFVAFAAGELHTCALTAAGTTYCWGNGWYGQLGTGSGVAGPAMSATQVTGSYQFRSLVARGNHTCSLDAAGVAYCWGLDYAGDLGNSSGVAPCSYAEPCRGSPMPVTDTSHFTLLSAGEFHTCGVTTSGVSECWGDNYLGQLGIGGHDGLSHAPTRLIGGIAFASLSAGGEFTCGLASAGGTYCWGPFLTGQTVDSATADSLRPVIGSPPLVELSAGYSHVCGLTAAGVAYCWGFGYSGSPAPVPGGGAYAHLYSGLDFTCALDATGAAYCWGFNSYAQLGNGTTNDSSTPVAVAGSLRFTALSAGGYHVCGLATSGLLYCWGDNYNGEIGDGNYYQLALVPTLVLGQP
jgi:alpha-tubulin suppressor-like RCC1 family protein/uncharacterized protein YjdB